MSYEERPPKGPINSSSDHHTASFTTSSSPDSTANTVPVQLRRRRGTSWRLPKLDPGRSDPWHYEPPGVSGYEDAAHHLLELGLTPAPNRDGLRAMWKRGGHSRQVADVITQTWGMTA